MGALHASQGRRGRTVVAERREQLRVQPAAGASPEDRLQQVSLAQPSLGSTDPSKNTCPEQLV